MRYSKRQLKSDAAMVSILEAKAAEIFEENEENVPSAAEKALAAGAPIADHRVHVDDQGFLTTKASVRSKSIPSNNV